MPHTLGYDVVIRHQVACTRVTILQKAMEHGNLVGLVALARVHLSPHLVHTTTDKLPKSLEH